MRGSARSDLDRPDQSARGAAWQGELCSPVHPLWKQVDRRAPIGIGA